MDMTKKHVTIYEVAREAGVSPATVSRILTGTARVRSVKRERVLEVIRQMNFQPNAFARALSENRNRMIGIMVAHTGNSYYNSLFAACQSEAYRRGYVSMVMNTYSRPQYEESVMMRMQEMRPEAVIIAGGRVDLEVPDPAFMDLLRATRESVRLVVGSRSPMPGIPGVAVDHSMSMEKALRYLADLGHRKIGYVYAGSPYYGTMERLRTFRKVMAELGIEVREDWLVEGADYGMESGIESIRAMMSGSDRPTAVLGMNDMVSAGILQGLQGMGLRVPEDVSVMGFDDTYISGITTPKLTSVGYNYEAYASLLLDACLFEGDMEAYPENQRIPVFITERNSCAAPADG